jgi:hypothetical protein
MLDYDEATDMDEDVGSPMENTLPPTNTDRWKATSMYDVYMVNTPNSPPRRRRRRRRGANGEPSGNNPTVDTAANDMEDPGKDLQASPERHVELEGIPRDSDPDDLFEGADDNYMLESEEDVSLGTEDFIFPEDPVEQVGGA